MEPPEPFRALCRGWGLLLIQGEPRALLLWGVFVVGALGLPQKHSEAAAASPEHHQPELPCCVVSLCVIFPSYTHKI